MAVEEYDVSLQLLRESDRRRQIFTYVGDNRRVSATEMRDALELSTGSLYHNLGQLRELITQDSRRNYVLTEQGRGIYDLLRKGKFSLVEPRRGAGHLGRVTGILLPTWLYTPMYESLAICFLMPLLSASLLAVLLAAARFELVLMFAFARMSINHWGFMFSFLMSLLGVFGFCSLAAHLLGGEGDHIRFLAALTVSLLPLAIFPTAMLMERRLGLGWFPPLGDPQAYYPQYVVQLIAQGLTLPFITAAVSHGKKMRWEKAAIVALGLFYLTIVVTTFIQSSPPT